METVAYLARLRELAPRPTVYAVAQLLDLPEQHVRNWYKGRSRPDTFACVRIAELLDLDPIQVIADIEAEREKDEGKKARWRELALKLGGRASSVLLIAFASYLYPSDARSGFARVNEFSPGINQSTNYATQLRRLRRFLQQLATRGFGRFPAFGS